MLHGPEAGALAYYFEIASAFFILRLLIKVGTALFMNRVYSGAILTYILSVQKHTEQRMGKNEKV